MVDKVLHINFPLTTSDSAAEAFSWAMLRIFAWSQHRSRPNLTMWYVCSDLLSPSVFSTLDAQGSHKNPTADLETAQFLSLRTFRFNYYGYMLAFCDRMQSHDLKHLTSVEIAICTQTSVDPWLDTVTRLPAELKHVYFKLRPLFQDTRTSQKYHLEYLETFGKIVENVARKAPDAHISISSTVGDLEPTLRASADRIMARLNCANSDTNCAQSSNE